MAGVSRGAIGEVVAARFLRQKGYTILSSNYRCRQGEIDIIASLDGYIVFAEVKTRRQDSMYSPREAVTAAKQRRISKGALYYMMKNGLMNRQARFDVIEIQGERVTHIVDAFPYQGPAF